MNRAGVRKPAVAGVFYPADESELRRMVRAYIQDAVYEGGRPRALIGPHAGYEYSGPVAGSAYKSLRDQREVIHRVLLLGPSHHVPMIGLGGSSAEAFETPFGLVPVDMESMDSLLEFQQVRIMDNAHEYEHSIETHLPFLQEMLDEFSVIPVLTGDATTEEVTEVIEKFIENTDTLIAVSSDLSHYFDYDTARRFDEAASRAIEQLNPEALHPEHACGIVPIQGLLLASENHGLSANTLDLRSSGDTAGPRDTVVGYGAFVFT